MSKQVGFDKGYFKSVSMKRSLLVLILLCCFFFSNAQKELWGVNTGNDYLQGLTASNRGNIIKFDINGENPVIMHEFDSIHGRLPMGKLFLASNGKLYGTASKGGNLYTFPNSTVTYEGGVLYEYDLIFDTFRVVKNFERVGNSLAQMNPQVGLIEPVSGKLFGATSEYLFNYNTATEATTITNTVGYIVNSELMKASDGNLYGTVMFNGHCTNTLNTLGQNGSLIKVNTATNAISFIHQFICDYTEGNPPNGQLIETLPGKLNGVTWNGAYYDSDGFFITTGGTLFEFDITANTFKKKLDFNKQTEGSLPQPLVNGGNGKAYGVCKYDGTNPDFTNQHFGTLFEYNPATNLITTVHSFGNHPSIGISGTYPTFLMKASTGKFFGSSQWGLFKFDPTSNSVTRTNANATADNLIEICRKPSYQEMVVTTFDLCAGDTFNYNLHNTNATNYVWKKGTTVLPLQTTAILNLSGLTLADAGAYTCIMTNECGTTTTIPLNVTINCLGTNTIANLDKVIKLYPNPAKEILKIELPTNIGIIITKYTLTNLLGQTINQTLTEDKIDVSPLEKGVYIIFLQTNYGKWNGKFVKN